MFNDPTAMVGESYGNQRFIVSKSAQYIVGFGYKFNALAFGGWRPGWFV